MIQIENPASKSQFI